MKWNGTVSQLEKTTMATRLASEKTTHATSSQANGHRSGSWRCGQCRPAGRCGQCRPEERREAPRPESSTGSRPTRSTVRSTARSWCGRPPGTTSAGELVALTTHRLDQVEPELGAQPPDADVHHVRARVEVVSPDRGEQLAFAH